MKMTAEKKLSTKGPLSRCWIYLCCIPGFALQLFFTESLAGQQLEVTGKAKITEMDTAISATANVVRKADGTLAVQQYKLGDFVHGGIVIWLDETGEHGLVCAKRDIDTIRWSPDGGASGATQALGDGPYSGAMNTAIIIPAQVSIGDDGNPYAARRCNEIQVIEDGKTYSDWYLPSKEELNLMYVNRAIINAMAQAHGGVALVADNVYKYWSSTEFLGNQTQNAWIQNFFDGVQSGKDKDDGAVVRPIRAF